MIRRLALSLASVFTLLALTMAPGDLQARQVHAGPRALTTLRVGYIPIGDFLPMYVAMARGYYRAQGLNIKLVPLAGGADIIPAIQGGSLDLGISNGLSLLLAASHGIDVVCITAGNYDTRAHPTHAILVMRNSRIHNAKDLEGKKVAVNTLNNIVHVITEQWMADHHANPAKTQFQEIDFPNMLGPLTHGQIDAAYEVEPFVTIGKSLKARVLTYPMAAEQKFTLVAPIVTLRSWAQKHPREAAGFARAFNQGIAFIKHHNARARQILTRFTAVKGPLAKQINLPVWRTHLQPASLQYWVKLGMRWHLLSKPLNVRKLIWSTAK